MTIRKRRAAAKPVDDVVNSDATAPQRVREDGVALDQWGLPAHGPLRALALEAMGKADPNHDVSEWGGDESVTTGATDQATGVAANVEPPPVVTGGGEEGLTVETEHG